MMLKRMLVQHYYLFIKQLKELKQSHKCAESLCRKNAEEIFPGIYNRHIMFAKHTFQFGIYLIMD